MMATATVTLLITVVAMGAKKAGLARIEGEIPGTGARGEVCLRKKIGRKAQHKCAMVQPGVAVSQKTSSMWMVFARLFSRRTRAAPMMKTKTVGQTNIDRTAKATAGQIADHFEGLATTEIQKMSIAKMERKRNGEGAIMGVAKVTKSSHY
jgi:hypothetical protein